MRERPVPGGGVDMPGERRADVPDRRVGGEIVARAQGAHLLDHARRALERDRRLGRPVRDEQCAQPDRQGVRDDQRLLDRQAAPEGPEDALRHGVGRMRAP
eukprot:g948.t1